MTGALTLCFGACPRVVSGPTYSNSPRGGAVWRQLRFPVLRRCCHDKRRGRARRCGSCALSAGLCGAQELQRGRIGAAVLYAMRCARELKLQKGIRWCNCVGLHGASPVEEKLADLTGWPHAHHDVAKAMALLGSRTF